MSDYKNDENDLNINKIPFSDENSFYKDDSDYPNIASNDYEENAVCSLAAFVLPAHDGGEYRDRHSKESNPGC